MPNRPGRREGRGRPQPTAAIERPHNRGVETTENRSVLDAVPRVTFPVAPDRAPLYGQRMPRGTLAIEAVDAEATEAAGAADGPGPAPSAADAPLLRALRGQPVERVPVWFMRQAGRSLPEYRAVRERATLMEITHSPELAAEVTLQPVRRHGVDAAILFSDIVTPLEATGFDVEIRPGVGPVIAEPIRTERDLRRLRPFEPAVDAPWLVETVRLLCAELNVPLIGFAGGPFTLASYLVEGGPSKTQARAKGLMLADPITWRELLDYLADIALASLAAQVAAGARAVQVFDSWIGSLSVRQYEEHVLPVVRRLFDGLAALGVPRIYFGLGTAHLLGPIGAVGADAVGLDWRIPLSEGSRRLPAGTALQGNLDPVAALAPPAVLEAEVATVLAEAPERGYVFNLGHGVAPETDPDVLTHIVELVHAHRATPKEAER
jgi:uroporphyrinogen decarboxylase